MCKDGFTDYKADLACKSAGFNRGAITWTSSSESPGLETSGIINVLICEEGATGLLDCNVRIASKSCEDHVLLHCKG